MAELPLDQAIPRFKTNEDRIDTFVNGDENATYTTSSGIQVPSVRKVVAELHDRSEVDTFAELATVTPSMLPVDGLIRVIETGAVYRRVSSGGDLDYTGSGGVRLSYVLGPFQRVDGFATSISAYAYAAARCRGIWSDAGGVRLASHDVQSANPALRDGLLRVARTRNTEGSLSSGSEQHGVVANVKVDYGAGARTKNTQTAAIMGVAETHSSGATYRADAVGIYGQGTIMDTTSAKAWGAFIAAALGKSDGTTDGELNGAEIAIVAMGVAGQPDMDTPTSKRGIWVVSPKVSVAGSVPGTVAVATATGPNQMGWYTCFAAREAIQTAFLASSPKSAGAVALDVKKSTNWDAAAVRLPSGKGIATYDDAGTSVASMLAGQDNGTVAQSELTFRIRRNAANSMMVFERTDTPAAGRLFANVQFRDRNSDGAAIQFARIAVYSSDITPGSEDGRFDFETMANGVSTVVAQVSGTGIAVGLPTGGMNSAGSVNVKTDYRVEGLKVLGPRITGWGAPTGTATRTAFATSTVTLSELAERVKALIDDLRTHGAIGS